jgi:hypothetical protein
VGAASYTQQTQHLVQQPSKCGCVDVMACLHGSGGWKANTGCVGMFEMP